MLWTTRDGREIPLNEMTDDHIRNAIAALSRWRSRIRKAPDQEENARNIADALSKFRRALKQRQRCRG